MPEFDYNGHTISYDEYGEGDRPLILIHGLLMSRRMFDRLGPEMAASATGCSRSTCSATAGRTAQRRCRTTR